MRSRLCDDTGRKQRSPRQLAPLCTALFCMLLAACVPVPALPASTATPDSVEYHNSAYGFTFSLPPTWRGYSLVVGNWTGTVSDPIKGDVPALQGPLISIRHPLWSAQNPRQDIPIMVFTHPQWDALCRGEFLVGAAPVRPSELGSNDGYVFALPARYDYAFPTGWQEVGQIIANHPLRTP